MSIVQSYIEIQIENNSSTFKRDNLINVPVKCKYSKLILFKLTSHTMSIFVSASVAKNRPFHHNQ